MSMNVGTDYSGSKTGFTSVDIPQAEKGDFEEHRKLSESVKPKYDEWKENNEKIRSNRPGYSSGVVYNRTEEQVDNSTYSINKMGASDRTAIVNQLKADAKERKFLEDTCEWKVRCRCSYKNTGT